MRAGNVPLPEAHLLGVAACGVLRWVRPWAPPGNRPTQRVVGGALLVAGSCLIVWSLHAAGPVDLGRPRRLVVSGPYAVSRNPMYVGWALLHLGAGLAAGSGWVAATLPAAATWVHGEIRREERVLGAMFPDGFAGYWATVPRYLPGGKPSLATTGDFSWPWTPTRRGDVVAQRGQWPA